MKSATIRWISNAGNFSDDQSFRPGGFQLRVRFWNGIEQCLRVGVFGIGKEGVAVCNFNYPAQIHDCHPIADVPDHRKVMSNKKGNNDSISKFIGKLSSSIDKAVAAMPGVVKDAAKKAGEVGAQIQANPKFKDMKSQL